MNQREMFPELSVETPSPSPSPPPAPVPVPADDDIHNPFTGGAVVELSRVTAVDPFAEALKAGQPTDEAIVPEGCE